MESSDQTYTSESAMPPKPPLGKNGYRKLRLYFFQFFMLFLAITAGFFAENLREELGERDQSREYANSLISDLARDTLNINYHISRMNVAVKKINELATYTRDKSMSELRNMDLYRLTLITWNPPFRWSRATLAQIKSSGSLRYFTNDSIVYYISQYDAWALHLDQDNEEDQQRYIYAVEKRSQVIDLNYPDEFVARLRANPDSIAQTAEYVKMSSSKQLLTNNMNDVKSMVNAYLVAKEYSIGRIKELTTLIHNQTRLIQLLKSEYSPQKKGR